MRINVRLFAILRDRAGVSEIEMTLPDESSASFAIAQLGEEFPSLATHLVRAAVAINREYASLDTKLIEGDELAIIPPVSGGSS